MTSTTHEETAAQHPAVFRRVVVCGALADVCASPDRDLVRNGIDLVARASCAEMLVALHEDAPDAVLVPAQASSGRAFPCWSGSIRESRGEATPSAPSMLARTPS